MQSRRNKFENDSLEIGKSYYLMGKCCKVCFKGHKFPHSRKKNDCRRPEEPAIQISGLLQYYASRKVLLVVNIRLDVQQEWLEYIARKAQS